MSESKTGYQGQIVPRGDVEALTRALLQHRLDGRSLEAKSLGQFQELFANCPADGYRSFLVLAASVDLTIAQAIRDRLLEDREGLVTDGQPSPLIAQHTKLMESARRALRELRKLAGSAPQGQESEGSEHGSLEIFE